MLCSAMDRWGSQTSGWSVAPGGKRAGCREGARLFRGFMFAAFGLCLQAIAFAQESQFQSLSAGMEQYRQGNYEKALEAFQRAATTFPENPNIPFYTGLTYLQLNQPERAIPEFRRALA